MWVENEKCLEKGPQGEDKGKVVEVLTSKTQHSTLLYLLFDVSSVSGLLKTQDCYQLIKSVYQG